MEKTPKRRKRLPKSVHMNISLIASLIRSDLEVSFKRPNANSSKHSKQINKVTTESEKIKIILTPVNAKIYQLATETRADWRVSIKQKKTPRVTKQAMRKLRLVVVEKIGAWALLKTTCSFDMPIEVNHNS
jgi:hypothetical protein